MTPQPRDMECREAVEQLYTFLDDELTPDAEAAVRSHLTRCRGCGSHFAFERAFLRFLEARTRAQAAPAHLRQRVFDRIFLERAGEEP